MNLVCPNYLPQESLVSPQEHDNNRFSIELRSGPSMPMTSNSYPVLEFIFRDISVAVSKCSMILP